MTAPTYAELSAAHRELFALIDPDTAPERYEANTRAFYRETGVWPPGWSRPPEMGGISKEEDQAAYDRWREWNNAQWDAKVRRFGLVVERLEPLIDSTGAALAQVPKEGA